jgi:hypothetical protein
MGCRFVKNHCGAVDIPIFVEFFIGVIQPNGILYLPSDTVVVLQKSTMFREASAKDASLSFS